MRSGRYSFPASRGPIQGAVSASDRRTVCVRGVVFELAGHAVLAADVDDYGTRLLAEHAPLTAGEQVLVIGAGSGLVALAAASIAGADRVTVVDADVAAVQYARNNLMLNGMGAVDVLAASDLAPVAGSTFDLIMTNVAWHPSPTFMNGLLLRALELVVVSGWLMVAGARDKGVLSSARRLEALCGNISVLAYRKGHRLVAAQRPAALREVLDRDAAVPAASEQTVELAGERFELELRPGVFASGALGDATRMLAESIRIRVTDHVLDLGCGSGIVGLVAARRARRGRALLVDKDLRAVDLARVNLARNGVPNAVVRAGDGYAAVANERFDIIATNPPWHAGRRQMQNIAHQFFDSAPRHLARGGTLYVVANAFLPYERRLHELFEQVTIVARDNRYKVLAATSPRVPGRADAHRRRGATAGRQR